MQRKANKENRKKKCLVHLFGLWPRVQEGGDSGRPYQSGSGSSSRVFVLGNVPGTAVVFSGQLTDDLQDVPQGEKQ